MNPIRRELQRRRNLYRCAQFESTRIYVAGDDASRIDWRVTARTGAFHVRERARDVPLQWSAVIDRSGSMLAGRVRPLKQSAAEAEAAWRASLEGDDRWIAVRNTDTFHIALRNAARLPAGTCVLVVSDFLDVENIGSVFGALGRRLDCTVLLAADPWRGELPLHGFVRVADLESHTSRRYFIGRCERARYRRSVAERETQMLTELRATGCRTGFLIESDGALSLRQVFGMK